MLTADQISSYRRNGFLVVPDVLGPQLLDRLRTEYTAKLDTLCAQWGVVGDSFTDKLIRAYRDGHDWFQPLDISLPGDRITHDTPFHFGPAVFDMLTSHRVLDVVESLIGPEITSNPIQHVRIKPPAKTLNHDEVRAHVGGTDWHQDRGVANPEADDTDMVTVWIAITDATVENGCLQVVPHMEKSLLPHCPNQQTAIAPGHLDTSRAVPLPVAAGGILLLDPYLPHSSLDNHTDGIRWSFDLRYNRTGQPTGRPHFPSFIARSRAEPDTELTDWRTWRGLWETARDTLADAPHIDLHRWSASAPACA